MIYKELAALYTFAQLARYYTHGPVNRLGGQPKLSRKVYNIALESGIVLKDDNVCHDMMIPIKIPDICYSTYGSNRDMYYGTVLLLFESDYPEKNVPRLTTYISATSIITTSIIIACPKEGSKVMDKWAAMMDDNSDYERLEAMSKLENWEIISRYMYYIDPLTRSKNHIAACIEDDKIVMVSGLIYGWFMKHLYGEKIGSLIFNSFVKRNADLRELINKHPNIREFVCDYDILETEECANLIKDKFMDNNIYI